MLSFTNPSPDAASNIQSMRLRDDPPPITRQTKKRKSPPADSQPQPQPQPSTQQQQQPQPPQIHPLPPPHALMHPMAPPLPPGYSYAPADYTPGGMPPGIPMPQQQQQQQQHQSQSPPPSSSTRALSSTKRAEQNRKAQRAFRERRDQHVKALEARSQLLDAALASADEANRRWEECRALVDQLRVENNALRAALAQQGQIMPSNIAPTTQNTNPTSSQPPSDDPKPADPAPEPKNDPVDPSS
ncbi:hypothetical protein JR316_0002227 [Psilocybe cubensis]|uniref:Uncharacterized protein n=2 Tax=Psilocybe cubensis TaxID=181762 RepID=A0ACB8HBW4_PSICU|nr:hypothetical protein JR316_0002227 [Psilocybe cubensis]KAH9485319.1 hypothetical protein JR316_0002227 [Psilocybe cubensis]